MVIIILIPQYTLSSIVGVIYRHKELNSRICLNNQFKVLYNKISINLGARK